jgi:acyl-coenzyme A thioesterase PaaI-like protein
VSTLEIPFNRHLGLEASTRPGCLFEIPAADRYTNHLGTVHAGALLALAEASSGEFMQREFPDLGFAVWPVVRRVEAKFRRPVRGAVHAHARIEPPPAKEHFVAALVHKGRALVTVHVELVDDDGNCAASVQVEWFVARADTSAGT